MYKRLSRSFTKNILVPLDYDVQQFINEQPNADYYESLYQYNEAHKKQFDETGSLAGITDVTTNRIVFDFDSESDVELARKDAVEIISRLIHNGIPEDQIQSFFSANKGFHVELYVTDNLNRKELENTVKNLAGDLDTFDAKIVDQQRVFRVSLTKHPKSKLYKIPLTVNELSELPIGHIRLKAKNPFTDANEYFDLMESWGQIDLPESIKKLKIVKEEKPAVELVVVSDETPEFSRKPKHMSGAKFALAEGYFESGERHEAYMVLASTYRAQGYNKEIAYNMLKATNRLQSRRTGQAPFDTDELWKNIVEYVYGPRWKGGNYAENENALLQKTIKKYNISVPTQTALVSVDAVTDIFTDFATNIDKNTIKLGIPYIDEDVRITTSMLVCLLAAPSAGKSSVSFGVLNTISRSGGKCLFFSMDMAAPLVYQRLIQRHTGTHSDAIFSIFKNKSGEVGRFAKTLSEEYRNVKFCFRSGLTVDDMKEVILKEKEITGELPKFVLIDYLECISERFSDSNANKALIAQKLKDMANELGICVFLLVQPAKIAGDPSYELNSYRAIKGSSVIEEAASVILTMHRPGFSPKTPENDKFLNITVVKNRMGLLDTFDFAWDGLTGSITAMTGEQEQALEDLRGKIRYERDEEKKNSIF